MAVEQQLADLTTAVNGVTAAVEADTTTRDAAVVAAQAAAATSTGAAAGAVSTVRGGVDGTLDTLKKLADLIAALGITNIAGLQTALAGKATPADIATAITALKNGADAAHDTLGEIQALLNADEGALAAALTAIGNRLVAASNLSDLTDKAAALATLNGLDRRILVKADAPSATEIPTGTFRVAGIAGKKPSVWVNDGTSIYDLFDSGSF